MIPNSWPRVWCGTLKTSAELSEQHPFMGLETMRIILGLCCLLQAARALSLSTSFAPGKLPRGNLLRESAVPTAATSADVMVVAQAEKQWRRPGRPEAQKLVFDSEATNKNVCLYKL